MKIKCNCAGHIRVCFIKDEFCAYEFEVVAGDLVTVRIPDDCCIEFVPFALFK